MSFRGDVFRQIEETIGKEYAIEYRMDGAFFRRNVLSLVEARGAEYGIKVPFYTWTG